MAGGLQHVPVGPQVGELVARLLLGDQQPVEASEAFGVHLALQLAADFLLGLPPQFQGDDLAGSLADAVGDVVAGDVEDAAVVHDAAHQNMGVRMAGVVVIDRDPVELGLEVGLHRLHQVAGSLPQVGQLDAFLGGNDEAELVAVVAAPVEEGATVVRIALGGIDLPLLAVSVDAIALQIAQVRVHRLGAGEAAAARCTTLGVELHDPGLHHHAPSAGPCAPRVPAPGVPPLQDQGHARAPAARIEPPASLPGRAQPIGVAAGASDGLMHVGQEGLWTWPDRPHGPDAGAVADPARTDVETVFVGRHDVTIGRSNRRYKVENGGVGLWRRNTCYSVETAESPAAHIAVATQNSIENTEKISFFGTGAPRRVGEIAPKNNVQTNT